MHVCISQNFIHLTEIFVPLANASDICLGISKILSTVAAENSDLVAITGGAEGQNLIAFVLECTNHPQREVRVLLLVVLKLTRPSPT